MGGNDDLSGVGPSQVIFNSAAGNTYYILVHGFAGATGNYDLNVSCGGGASTKTKATKAPTVKATKAPTTKRRRRAQEEFSF